MSGIISAMLIRRSRKPYYCLDGAGEGHTRLIPVGSMYLRLYGSPDGDQPGVLPLCMPCAFLCRDTLAVAALDGLRDEEE